MKNLRIFETGNRFGNMNTGKAFFPKEYENDATKRKELFLENRKKAASVFGFNPLKFYMPTQVRDGSHQVLTREMVLEKEDGWDLDISADILIVTDKTPEVVAGYPVADCAVVIASDLKNGVTATAHCSGEFVDRYLPKLAIESLKEEFDSKNDDIFVYISACAGKTWTYDNYPSWAKNTSLWEESGAIKEENGIFRIDLRCAILSQIDMYSIKGLAINQDDTITNDNYYSHSAAYHGEKKKNGRHFAGAFYKSK